MCNADPNSLLAKFDNHTDASIPIDASNNWYFTQVMSYLPTLTIIMFMIHWLCSGIVYMQSCRITPPSLM